MRWSRLFALKPPDESLKITTKRPSWASLYPNASMKGGDSMKRFLFTAALCLLVAAVTLAGSICWSMTHVQVAVYDGEAALSLCGNMWIHDAE